MITLCEEVFEFPPGGNVPVRSQASTVVAKIEFPQWSDK